MSWGRCLKYLFNKSLRASLPTTEGSLPKGEKEDSVIFMAKALLLQARWERLRQESQAYSRIASDTRRLLAVGNLTKLGMLMDFEWGGHIAVPSQFGKAIQIWEPDSNVTLCSVLSGEGATHHQLMGKINLPSPSALVPTALLPTADLQRTITAVLFSSLCFVKK